MTAPPSRFRSGRMRMRRTTNKNTIENNDTTSSSTILPLSIPSLQHGAPGPLMCVEIAADQQEKGSEASVRTTSDETPTTRIRQLSNVATILCILDCTLLPAVTVVLPWIGILNLGNLEWLGQISHALTVFFVLPVGALSSLLNYHSHHRQGRILALAIMGLLLIAIANSHSLIIVQHIECFHLFHNGPMHRLTNLLGCACLLSSNFWSRRNKVYNNNNSSITWCGDECASCPSPRHPMYGTAII